VDPLNGKVHRLARLLCSRTAKTLIDWRLLQE
jgi:hypothetical protein